MFLKLKTLDLIKTKEELDIALSVLKKDIFKHSIQKEEVDYSKVQDFERITTRIITAWGEGVNEIKNTFRTSPVQNPPSVSVGFEDIKNFIYGKFDYASVLQFGDGLEKGMSDGSIRTAEDIDDFYRFTVSTAFNDLPPDADALVAQVTDESMRNETNPNLEMNSFKNMYKVSLFEIGDKNQLIKSIHSVLLYMYQHNFMSDLKDYDDITKSAVAITATMKILEYIAYSIMVYATRVYVIYNYSLPFITAPISESGEVNIDDISEDPSGEVSNIFQITDELLIRDINKKDELMERFFKFIETTSGKRLTRNIPKDRRKFTDRLLKNNRFHQLLKDNQLYDLLFSDAVSIALYTNPRDSLNSLKVKIMDSLFNPKFWHEDTFSPRNEFLNHIKLAKCDYESLADCRDCAYDLFVFGTRVADMISILVQKINSSFSEGDIARADLNYRKTLSELASFLSSFYGEMMFIVVQRAGFLERMINGLVKKQAKQISKVFTINSPDECIKSLIASADSATLCSIPDTTRMSPNQEKEYHLASFQLLEFYDEFLSSQNEFKNHQYFKEAVDGAKLSTIINKIMATIKAFFAKALAFFTSNNFKNAQKWVADRRDVLLKASFSKIPPDPSDVINVFDYKPDINLMAAVNLTNFKTFITGINVVDAVKDVPTFTTNCYKALVSETYLNFLIGPDVKDPARAYKNALLFNTVNQDGSPSSIPVDSNEKLSHHIAIWVSTVIDSTNLVAQIKTAETNVDSISNVLKGKIANAVNELNKAKAGTGATGDSLVIGGTPTPAATPGQAQQNVAPTDAVPMQEAVASYDGLLNAYAQVLNMAFLPLVKYTIETVQNQYKYIQFLYSRSAK